jgi:hypothetical protein
MGLLRIGNNDFARVNVSGLNRVPYPPAKIMASMK